MQKYGVLGINKPLGISSFDVIRQLKKKIKIQKIGHGGTLDPMADGVLPILINEGTAFFDLLLQSSKIYRTTIQLGIARDTDDQEGEIICEKSVPTLTIDMILKQIESLTGEIQQIPPAYSALKVNGKRAYDLAREGKEVELKARTVCVYRWENISYDDQEQTICADIHCGSGTYIRSLGRDLAEKLGTVGYLKSLRRLKSGGISLEQCYTLEEISENWEELLIGAEKALDFVPILEWKGTLEHLKNGKPLYEYVDVPSENGAYRLMFQGELIALLELDGRKLSYKKNFANLF